MTGGYNEIVAEAARRHTQQGLTYADVGGAPPPLDIFIKEDIEPNPPPVVTLPTAPAYNPDTDGDPALWLNEWWPQYWEARSGLPPELDGWCDLPPGTPKNLWHHWPKHWEPPHPSVQQWVTKQATGQLDRNTGIAIQGNYGTGKTTLLAAAWRTLWPAAVAVPPAQWWTARQLVDHLKPQRGAEQANRQRWHTCTTAAYLAIDDLGAETETDWNRDIITRLIEERYDHGLSVCYTTNLTPDARIARYGDRTVDRLNATTVQITIQGQSKRRPPTL